MCLKRLLQRPSNTDLSALFAGGREAKMEGEDESFDRLRTWVWALEEVRSRLKTERGKEEMRVDNEGISKKK